MKILSQKHKIELQTRLVFIHAAAFASFLNVSRAEQIIAAKFAVNRFRNGHSAATAISRGYNLAKFRKQTQHHIGASA